MPVTNYIWDDDNIVAEVDENGDTIVEYTYNPGPQGELISQRRWDGTAWQTRIHHYDAQGSTIALTDETGALTDSYTYDAFGNEIAHSGTTKNPFRWNGKFGYYWDEELGSYYVRERTYEPVIGRWLSADPLGIGFFFLVVSGGANIFEGDQNVYRYAAQNPVTAIDPSGLITMQHIGHYGCKCEDGSTNIVDVTCTTLCGQTVLDSCTLFIAALNAVACEVCCIAPVFEWCHTTTLRSAIAFASVPVPCSVGKPTVCL